MEFVDLLNELRKRYDECDSEGHKEPDIKNNSCNYCYRQLEYNQLENPDIPQLARKNRKSIRFQQRIDYNNGLKRLEEELSKF